MNRWMQMAYDEALSGMRANDGGPFGAVIVHNDQVISQTHNEVLRTNDPTAHAEINAIRIASQKLGRFDLSDCILYTTCYPCPMCMGAILWAHISTVYYGATEADATRGGFNDESFHIHNPRDALDLRPLDLEKTRTLFDKWLAKGDRSLY